MVDLLLVHIYSSYGLTFLATSSSDSELLPVELSGSSVLERGTDSPSIGGSVPKGILLADGSLATRSCDEGGRWRGSSLRGFLTKSSEVIDEGGNSRSSTVLARSCRLDLAPALVEVLRAPTAYASDFAKGCPLECSCCV